MDILLTIPFANGMTATFTIIIPALFFGALFMVARNWPDEEKAATVRRAAPGILISIGVFGTFWGILDGLIEFDPTSSETINDSVPRLLRGLITAFWSSVLGMGAGLVWRTGQAFIGDTSDDNSFAKEVADAIAKALGEPFQNLIESLNKILEEHLGKSIERLKEAMEQVLEWQENNKQQMENLLNAFQEIQTTAEALEGAAERMAESAEKMTEIANAVETSVGTLENQRQALEALLAGIAKMTNDFNEVLPQIQENVQRITTQFTEATTKALEEINSAVSSASANLQASVVTTGQNLEGTVSTVGANLQEAVDVTGTSMREAVTDTEIIMKKAVTDTGASMREVVTDARKDMKEASEQSSQLIVTSIDQIKKQQEEFERSFREGMDRLMGRVVEELGRYLVAVFRDIFEEAEQRRDNSRTQTGNERNTGAQQTDDASSS